MSDIVTAGQGHIPDPDRRGPDWDNPKVTQAHFRDLLAHRELYGAPPEPIAQTPASTANFTATRLGYGVNGVIIHTTVGSEASAVSAFQSPTRQASAHYVIACDGSHIDQCVAESNIAWHCGRFYTDATDPLANCNTIGIEHCDNGNYNSPRPDGLYQCSADLVKDICTRYGIPIDRTHIRKHREVSQLATSCPDSLDIDRIVAMANGTWVGPTPAPTGDDDMVYVGPVHALAGSFKMFVAGASYPDPAPVAAVAAPLASGASVSVDAYCYSTTPTQSSDLGGGVAGPDYLYWRSGGRWVPDAFLDTTTMPTAPKPQIPAGEALALYPPQGGGGVTMAQIDAEIALKIAGLATGLTQAQVDAEIAKIVAGLPPGLTKDQVDAEILTALGNLPKPTGVPHHHGVLGIINTGPVIPD